MRIVLLLLATIGLTSASLLRRINPNEDKQRRRRTKGWEGSGCGVDMSMFGLDPDEMNTLCDESNAFRTETCTEPAKVPTGIDKANCDNINKFCTTGDCYIIRTTDTLTFASTHCTTPEGIQANWEIQPYAAELICKQAPTIASDQATTTA